MLFSVVIPVYNVENYIKECLEYIIPQAEKCSGGCEILLVDDGSTDSSGMICDKYKENYPQLIRVFHKENEGLLLTRRYGFKRASGNYVIDCDSDDLLEPDMLKKVQTIIADYDEPDVIIINHNMYDGKNRTVAYENIFTNEHDCCVEKRELLREFMLGHNVVSVCGKIVKRSCISVDMDYSEFGRLSTGEDTLQSIEFFSNSKTYVYLNEALYDYRCGSGMTAKFDSNYYFTFKRVFKEIEKQKVEWDLDDFNELFAVKVLQTVGRAITQSRLNKWDSLMSHKRYLQEIRNDDMSKANLKYVNKSKKYLQFDHYVLLILFKCNLFVLISLLLYCKNLSGSLRDEK